METNELGAVPQTDASSASTENNQTQTQTVVPDGIKQDMFKYKQEAATLREQLKTYELEKEQKKGNFEGVISSLKEEIKTLKGSNAKDKFSFAQNQLDNAIRTEAMAKGLDAKKVDVFMKLIDESDKGVVELDDNFNVNKDDVVNLVTKSMDRYSDIGLFNKQVKIVDGVPSGKVEKSDTKLDVSKMTAAQLEAYIVKNHG
jgi:hypothetical protein